MTDFFRPLGARLFGATRRTAGSAERGAERDASFVEREAARGGSRTPGRNVAEPRDPGHTPGGGTGSRPPIDLVPPRGASGGILGGLGAVAGGAGEMAMAALTSSGGVWAMKTGAKLGVAYYLLMMARDYANNAFFGKDAMAAQAAAESGQPPSQPIPGGTGLPGGAGALPDGTAVPSGADVVRRASMTPQVATGMMGTDRRYAVGMNAMDAANGPTSAGSSVSSVVGPLAGGGSFFMLAEQAGPGARVDRSFTAAAGPQGGVLSASRTSALPNGVLERTVVEHGDGVAGLAPMGPLDRSARVIMGPDAPAAAGRLSSALREPDALSPLLGASSLGDMKAHSVQTGGTDRRTDVVFSGVGKDGKQVTGGMSFADGAAKLTLFGSDGKTPVWSKDLDGSGVSMSPTGVPVLSGKSAADVGEFTKSPVGFKQADDLARSRDRPSGLATGPGGGPVPGGSALDRVPGATAPGGLAPAASSVAADPSPSAPATVAAVAPAGAGKIQFYDWDRDAGSPFAAGPSSRTAGVPAGGSRFASGNPSAKSVDPANPLAVWARLGAGRDDPAGATLPGLGRSGPSLGGGPGL